MSQPTKQVSLEEMLEKVRMHIKIEHLDCPQELKELLFYENGLEYAVVSTLSEDPQIPGEFIE